MSKVIEGMFVGTCKTTCPLTAWSQTFNVVSILVGPACESQLLDAVHTWKKSMEDRKSVDVLFLNVLIRFLMCIC